MKDLLTGHRQQSSFLRIVILNGGIFHLESQKRPSWICGSLVSWSATNQLEKFPCGSMQTILLSLRNYSRPTAAKPSNMLSADRFILDEVKSKELCITFTRSQRAFDPIKVDSKNLDCVKKAKILCNLTSYLKWNDHVYKIIKKVTKYLYFLSQMKMSSTKTLRSYNIFHHI